MTKPALKFTVKAPRDNPEARLQRAVVQHLLLAGHGDVVWFHVPNGMKSTGRHVNNMKRMGLRPGVADLVILADGKAYCMELKAKGGKQTVEQIAFQEACELAGVPYVVCDNLQAAITVLRDWKLIRKMTVTA